MTSSQGHFHLDFSVLCDMCINTRLITLIHVTFSRFINRLKLAWQHTKCSKWKNKKIPNSPSLFILVVLENKYCKWSSSSASVHLGTLCSWLLLLTVATAVPVPLFHVACTQAHKAHHFCAWM